MRSGQEAQHLDRRSAERNASLLTQLAAVKSGAAQMFGVNLGSWLVLEQYMVPSVYALVSGGPYGERQLMQVLGDTLMGGRFSYT